METMKAPTGPQLSCKGWEQEGLLRLLMNCLDGRVAENPAELVVYGATGKAARDWDSCRAILDALQKLENDETLVIQSGRPVGIFPTYETAPRVVHSCAMLVPAWGNWTDFRRVEEKGLTMFGQATAASWSYIGTQGILQGTCETLGELAAQYFDGTLAGRLVLTSGLGGMSGAQPLAVTMHGGVVIVVEADEKKIRRRLAANYCEMMAASIDEALELAHEARVRKEPRSIALLGNAASVYPELAARGVHPDVVTDQTAAHDLLHGYIPEMVSPEQAVRLRRTKPKKYLELARSSIRKHVTAMLDFQRGGSVVFDYGNNIRLQGKLAGVADSFDFPGYIPAFIRKMFCEGRGPCRWVALSGDPADIYKIDEVILERFPQDHRTCRWLDFVQDHIMFAGLPARTCWLDFQELGILGGLINDMVRTGQLAAPVAITRDHMDGSAAASPYRETEAMQDGSDIIADWPVLNAMLNGASGAAMVTLQHGGGVGIGYSIHAGMTLIADGTECSAGKLARVLRADPRLGILRHADAGYAKARRMLQRI